MADSVFGKVSSEDNDSENQSEINCDSCEQDGESKPAVGFCIECQSYLCDQCFQYHRLPRPTRHHRLLDKNEMPKRKVTRSLSEICQKHEGETMKFYCKSHEAIGCNSCMVIEHKPCQEICSLAEIAKGVEKSEKYKSLCDKMIATKEEIEDQIKVALENIELSKSCREEAVAGIDEFQEQMTKKLQQLRHEITKQAKEKEKKDIIKIKQFEAIANGAKEDLHDFETDMKILEETKQSKQLFIAMKQVEKQHEDIERKLENVKKESKAERYSFVRNDLFSSMMQNVDALGELYIHEAGNSLKEMHSSYSNFLEYGNPKFMTTQGNQAIMTDSIYNKVYLVEKSEIVAERTLTSLPWDIAQIEENKFAVTLPNERKIKIISVADKEIMENKEIKIDARCEGVAYTENTLFVACTNPPSVIILDISGKIIQTIAADENGCPLFKQPAYIDFDKERNLICVTDRQNATVTLTTIEGKVHKVYKLDKLDIPASVLIDQEKGIIYVADCKNSSGYIIKINTGECEYVTSAEKFCGSDEVHDIIFFKGYMKHSNTNVTVAGLVSTVIDKDKWCQIFYP